MNRTNGTIAALVAGIILAALIFGRRAPTPPSAEEPQEATRASVTTHNQTPAALDKTPSRLPSIAKPDPDSPTAPVSKSQKLADIRETFRALAQSDRLAAIRAAKAITNENERETALLTLAAEWTNGELRLPSNRAKSIAEVGLDAAIGMELAAHPELALLWADEFGISGAGRNAILTQVARAMIASDPASAFNYGNQIPENERAKFNDDVFNYWAYKDTAAAMRWAEQLPESDRAAAIKSIRNTAPVGIGAAIGIEGGYPVIQSLVPGAAAELSGQLHPGDRLLAIAQGDNQFIDARNMPLPDIIGMIRGSPDSLIQIQVWPADAKANSSPRTVHIVRGQINFKQPTAP
jgi:hypothetical protein